MNFNPPFSQPAEVPPSFWMAYSVPQMTVPPSGVSCIDPQSDGLEIGVATVSRARLAVIRLVPEPVTSRMRS
jgi:hypothetical protein